jgi:hypothetical protein
MARWTVEQNRSLRRRVPGSRMFEVAELLTLVDAVHVLRSLSLPSWDDCNETFSGCRQRLKNMDDMDKSHSDCPGYSFSVLETEP